MPDQSICIKNDKNTVSIKLELEAFIEKERPGMYVSHCPALDLYSQGDTLVEAKKNIKEATELFIQSCIMRNTLTEVLTECGFRSVYKTNSRKAKRASPPANSTRKRIQFPSEIPMMSAL